MAMLMSLTCSSQVLITTYELILKDASVLSKV